MALVRVKEAWECDTDMFLFDLQSFRKIYRAHLEEFACKSGPVELDLSGHCPPCWKMADTMSEISPVDFSKFAR